VLWAWKLCSADNCTAAQIEGPDGVTARSELVVALNRAGREGNNTILPIVAFFSTKSEADARLSETPSFAARYVL
jgi:hypothetical protein